jgi:hypothetical protein
MITILKKDVETLLDKKIGIEDNQTERERQDIIARSDFKEIPNRFLRSELSALYSVTHKFRGIAFWCGITILCNGSDLRVHAFAPCLGVSAA